NKIKGAGHNLCFGDVNGSVSPCLEFKAWVTLEFPLLADGIAGAVVNISPTGVIRGWAMDPRNPAATISVFVYVNGPAGQGQLVQQVVANQSSVDQFNGHYFTVSLPAQYADGTMKSLYI